MTRRHHTSRARPATPVAARTATPPMEALARTASEAAALLADLADVSERALTALRRGDTEGLFGALEERDALRDRITPLVRALASGRVALVADPRRAADARALAALMSPVERLAARGATADAQLAQLAAAHRNDLARAIRARHED